MITTHSEFFLFPTYVHQMARFFYKNPGLYLFLLHVYRLPRAYTLPVLKRYAGCRSWVDLQEKIPTAGAVPVLPGEAFAQQVQEVREVLASSLAA